ncbi:hypothetical protein HDC34_000974 [Pseudoclavibacter sp. JAI123]|nr:hypothetical protein [Pseudoclavibacter sp. JAI123]
MSDICPNPADWPESCDSVMYGACAPEGSEILVVTLTVADDFETSTVFGVKSNECSVGGETSLGPFETVSVCG